MKPRCDFCGIPDGRIRVRDRYTLCEECASVNKRARLHRLDAREETEPRIVYL